MKKKFIVLSGFVLGLAPVVVFAQTGGIIGCAAGAAVTTVQTFICKIGDILNIIIPILIVLGVLYFIWGVITYVIGSDEEAKKAGRNKIIAGVIGLTVIVAVWGLVQILKNTFNLGGSKTIDFPTTPY